MFKRIFGGTSRRKRSQSDFNETSTNQSSHTTMTVLSARSSRSSVSVEWFKYIVFKRRFQNEFGKECMDSETFHDLFNTHKNPSSNKISSVKLDELIEDFRVARRKKTTVGHTNNDSISVTNSIGDAKLYDGYFEASDTSEADDSSEEKRKVTKTMSNRSVSKPRMYSARKCDIDSTKSEGGSRTMIRGQGRIAEVSSVSSGTALGSPVKTRPPIHNPASIVSAEAQLTRLSDDLVNLRMQMAQQSQHWSERVKHIAQLIDSGVPDKYARIFSDLNIQSDKMRQMNQRLSAMEHASREIQQLIKQNWISEFAKFREDFLKQSQSASAAQKRAERMPSYAALLETTLVRKYFLESDLGFEYIRSEDGILSVNEVRDGSQAKSMNVAKGWIIHSVNAQTDPSDIEDEMDAWSSRQEEEDDNDFAFFDSGAMVIEFRVLVSDP